MYYKQKFWRQELGAEKKKKVQKTVLLENTNGKDESE